MIEGSRSFGLYPPLSFHISRDVLIFLFSTPICYFSLSFPSKIISICFHQATRLTYLGNYRIFSLTVLADFGSDVFDRAEPPDRLCNIIVVEPPFIWRLNFRE